MPWFYRGVMTTNETPRTDTKWSESKLYNEVSFEIALDMCNFSKQLERELSAVTEQLKEAHEELARAGVGAYKANYFLGELTETGKIRSDLIRVTEQLNEHKLALQASDKHNHEIATKLETASEQRDRLADVMSEFLSVQDHCGCVYRTSPITEKVKEALQSLNKVEQ